MDPGAPRLTGRYRLLQKLARSVGLRSQGRSVSLRSPALRKWGAIARRHALRELQLRLGMSMHHQQPDRARHAGPVPTRLTGVFHPSGSTLTIAKPVSSRIRAFGMEFHNDGKSAFSAPFSWEG